MQVLQLEAPVPNAVALQDKAVHVPGRLLQLCFCGRRVVLVDGALVVQVAFAQQLDRDGPAQRRVLLEVVQHALDVRRRRVVEPLGVGPVPRRRVRVPDELVAFGGRRGALEARVVLGDAAVEVLQRARRARHAGHLHVILGAEPRKALAPDADDVAAEHGAVARREVVDLERDLVRAPRLVDVPREADADDAHVDGVAARGRLPAS